MTIAVTLVLLKVIVRRTKPLQMSTLQVRRSRGVDPYGTGGTRPPNVSPQYLDWGDMITNVPPIFLE